MVRKGNTKRPRAGKSLKTTPTDLAPRHQVARASSFKFKTLRCVENQLKNVSTISLLRQCFALASIDWLQWKAGSKICRRRTHFILKFKTVFFQRICDLSAFIRVFRPLGQIVLPIQLLQQLSEADRASLSVAL
ncbi:hypothetical protein CYMTET_54191 [Cymbomonas tetramitiformis]|uniref:Uncharacterized protein n=1 Tax=Cymbomonas tetramitiformis TaxID=36881 RepID=A0AAE0BGM4_9CHLO|nr:hypothetical protein CYMTET_54191 [Cymbomonas tetramitiformis]